MTMKPTRDRHSRANTGFGLLDPQLTLRWPRFTAQSLLTAAALGTILVCEDLFVHGVIVVAIAASTALVFFAPHSVAASSRRLIGGHVMGVVAAGAAWGLLRLCCADPSSAAVWVEIGARAGAVGLAVLLMTATDTEHAPAAGTALALVADAFPVHEIVFILSGVFLLSLVRLLLLRWLRDLV